MDMKRTQGTENLRCLTCLSFQAPDGGDWGLCFEARQSSKRAPRVRESEVCGYWKPRERPQVLIPVSIRDRIFAAMVLSNGRADRCCQEIVDWINQHMPPMVYKHDVARYLEHLWSSSAVHGGSERFACMREWTERWQVIMQTRNPIRFRLAAGSAQAFELRFAEWLREQRGAR